MEQEKDELKEKDMRKLFPFLFSAGFKFEYTYSKGSDSSCVYIYRFQRGAELFDFRFSSEGNESFVVFAHGEYKFPNLKKLQPKLTKKFRLKHLFRKPTEREILAFYAEVLQAENKDKTLFSVTL